MGGAGQEMAGGIKNNCTLKHHMTWGPPVQLNPYS